MTTSSSLSKSRRERTSEQTSKTSEQTSKTSERATGAVGSLEAWAHPAERFRSGFAPQLLASGALSAVLATGIAHASTAMLEGQWWIGPPVTGPILWTLTLAAALAPYWTARQLSASPGVPWFYWLQSSLQIVWLLYLAWSSHSSVALVAVLLLLSAVVNDTRYFYDSRHVRLHYMLAAPSFGLFLLVLDLLFDAGLLARSSSAPDTVSSAIAALVVGSIACQFIIGVVGGQWRRLDEQLLLNSDLERRVASLKAEHGAIMKASDFMMHGLSAGRFTHDVASPLSSIAMSVSQLRALHRKDPASVQHEIRGCILDTLDAALVQLQTHSLRLVNAIRTPPKTAPQHIGDLIERAIDSARRTGAKRDQVEHFEVSIAAELSMVEVCSHHEAALGDLISNAARASGKEGIEIGGLILSDELYELTIRDFGSEGEAQRRARETIERALAFDPDQTPLESARGLGIGLILARLVMVRHGGEITVREAPGRGIEMSVTLPRVPPRFLSEASLSTLATHARTKHARAANDVVADDRTKHDLAANDFVPPQHSRTDS